MTTRAHWQTDTIKALVGRLKDIEARRRSEIAVHRSNLRGVYAKIGALEDTIDHWEK